MAKDVYILIDNYDPDGARIYGVYSTYAKAEKAQEIYESDDNEYGKGCDSLDIESHEVE